MARRAVNVCARRGQAWPKVNPPLGETMVPGDGMRGFLLGGLFGGFLSVAGLSLASLLAPQPPGNAPPSPPLTSMTSTDAPAAEQEASQTLPDTAERAPQAGQTVPNVESQIDPAPRAETEPAAPPEASAPPAPLPAPDVPAAQPELASETPVLPSPQGQVLREPVAENDLLISTEPAQPVAPIAEETAFAPEAPAAAPETETGAAPSGAEAAPEQVPAEPESPAASAAPQGQMPQSTVPVRRAETSAAPSSALVPEASALPALERFAADFETDGRPGLAVIIIDTSPQTPGPALLSQLDLPVSVALRASDPDAGARAAQYRAAGVELLLLSDLPAGAEASDAATALEAALASMPEAIALLDAGQGGLGRDPAIISTSLARLGEEGMAFVSLAGGLNTAQRRAEREGIPALELYRDLDGDGQSAAVIRRFLDQAAFRARQQGEVAVLLRLRPESLSALELWKAASRAQEVQIVPLSAVLRASGQ